MKRKIYFVLGILFVLIVILLIVLIKPLQKKEVCVKEKCFEVEIADTQKLMSKGLSERDFLDDDKGMLFIFNSLSSSNFWMKDMKFSLDIIGINDNNEIIKIVKDAKPCEERCLLFYFGNQTKYVLEVNAGLSEKYGFEEGDFIILKV